MASHGRKKQDPVIRTTMSWIRNTVFFIRIRIREAEVTCALVRRTKCFIFPLKNFCRCWWSSVLVTVPVCIVPFSISSLNDRFCIYGIRKISWKWKFVCVKVPFLSVGADSVGARTERCRGRSQLSGDYVVEDVQIGEQFFRQEGDILFMIKSLLVNTKVNSQRCWSCVAPRIFLYCLL